MKNPSMSKWHIEQKEFIDRHRVYQKWNKLDPRWIVWTYRERIYNKVITDFTKGGYLGLEIGCGAGRTCKFLKDRGRNIIGIDPLLDIYERVTDGLIRGIGEQLPFQDYLFDFCCMKDTLDHTISPAKTLQEIVRVLKLGGTLILCQNVREKEKHQHYFDQKDLLTLLETSGLMVYKIIPLHIDIPIPWRVKKRLMRFRLYLSINRWIARVAPRYASQLIIVAKKLGEKE